MEAHNEYLNSYRFNGYELKNLIRETVTQTILELFGDPDEGLDLREEFQDQLKLSLAEIQQGGKITPVEQVAQKLGLDW